MSVERKALLTIYLTALVGITAAIGGVGSWWSGGTGPVTEVAAFTVLLTLNWVFPMLVLRHDETEAFQLDEAFFVITALLLPPVGTVLVFAVASLGSQLLRRRPADRILFNTGQVVASSIAGLVVVRAIAIPDGSVTPVQLLAAVMGAAAFLAVNTLFVSTIISVTGGIRFLEAAVDGIAFRLLVWVATVAVGLLAGLGATAYGWALVLAVVPMIILQLVLTSSLRARRDRERVDGLLQTALRAHASFSVADVEDALTAAARELLECRSARISDAPPADDELGVAMTGDATDRWLVVGGRRGFEAFSPSDTKLLNAILAVGNGALENARLVEQVKHQAFHDTLTGLPNQLLFEERVTYALGQAQRTGGGRIAVLQIDLDRFKQVNDALGHPAGNALLVQVAERLTTHLRGGDTVARLGGDEFAVLLPSVRNADEAAAAAAALVDVLRRPFRVDDHQLYVTGSIGVAVTPEAGERAVALRKAADAAMYRAKHAGRNGWHVYAEGDDMAGVERIALEADLHHALEAGELEVAYQPQVDMVGGQVVGAEALVRWSHPVHGNVSPDMFIPLAEESGLIGDLDAFVLREACAKTQSWVEQGLPPIRVAVNLSGRDFQRDDVVHLVMETLASTGLSPDQLELEVTETVAVDETADVCPVLEELRNLGIHVAMDDFGTGYSMLGRLRQLPLDKLKIDKSFVQEITEATSDAPIVAATIAMAHGLHLEVVAEGVETTAQLEYLTRLGCDRAQGYLVSKPVKADAMADILRREGTPTSVGAAARGGDGQVLVLS